MVGNHRGCILSMILIVTCLLKTKLRRNMRQQNNFPAVIPTFVKSFFFIQFGVFGCPSVIYLEMLSIINTVSLKVYHPRCVLYK